MATTQRQKLAVQFCEQYLEVKFTGDLNNFQQVSAFLGQYLNEAKDVAELEYTIAVENSDILDKDYYA